AMLLSAASAWTWESGSSTLIKPKEEWDRLTVPMALATAMFAALCTAYGLTLTITRQRSVADHVPVVSSIFFLSWCPILGGAVVDVREVDWVVGVVSVCPNAV